MEHRHAPPSNNYQQQMQMQRPQMSSNALKRQVLANQTFGTLFGQIEMVFAACRIKVSPRYQGYITTKQDTITDMLLCIKSNVTTLAGYTLEAHYRKDGQLVFPPELKQDIRYWKQKLQEIPNEPRYIPAKKVLTEVLQKLDSEDFSRGLSKATSDAIVSREEIDRLCMDYVKNHQDDIAHNLVSLQKIQQHTTDQLNHIMQRPDAHLFTANPRIHNHREETDDSPNKRTTPPDLNKFTVPPDSSIPQVNQSKQKKTLSSLANNASTQSSNLQPATEQLQQKHSRTEELQKSADHLLNKLIQNLDHLLIRCESIKTHQGSNLNRANKEILDFMRSLVSTFYDLLTAKSIMTQERLEFNLLPQFSDVFHMLYGRIAGIHKISGEVRTAVILLTEVLKGLRGNYLRPVSDFIISQINSLDQSGQSNKQMSADIDRALDYLDKRAKTQGYGSKQKDVKIALIDKQSAKPNTKYSGKSYEY
jgi:oligoribonuclease (3'-5' exoribonuclease)